MKYFSILIFVLFAVLESSFALPPWKRTTTTKTTTTTKKTTSLIRSSTILKVTSTRTSGLSTARVSTIKTTTTKTTTTKTTTTKTTTTKTTTKSTGIQSTLPPPNGKSNLVNLLSKSQFQQMFPNADYGSSLPYFTYENLIKAADYFPQVFGSSNRTVALRELAAFFGQTAHETTGGWSTAPGGAQAWGYVFNQEVGCDKGVNVVSPCTQYTSCTVEYPCAQGTKSGYSQFQYFGRGPMQLSWNYQYGQASASLFGDKMVLINDPAWVARDGMNGFLAALWFWTTPQWSKPSSHDVMTTCLSQLEAGTSVVSCGGKDLAGRLPGFGLVTNIINGGIECGSGTDMPQSLDRIAFYQRFLGMVGVDGGPGLSCKNQVHF